MATSNKTIQKIIIPFFEGTNSSVSFNIAKKTEFIHMENSRSVTIGTIEKREGQEVLGLTTSNEPFITTNNYAIFPFTNPKTKGLYRISVAESPTLSIQVEDVVGIFDTFALSEIGDVDLESNPLMISVKDSINLTDRVNENTGNVVTIYYINSDNQWVPLTGSGANIPGGMFSYTQAEDCLFLVNLNSLNRYITSDGTSIITSSTASGHLYNTPQASLVNFYKNRLYLADFIRSQTRYKTTILRSSYPMGIVALLNADYATAASGTTIDVTDTKYIYATSGANTYDIYRGGTLISTITVTTVNETSIVATWTGTPSFLASDEVWISGTYDGPKVFRWVRNASSTGKNVQQYDTFKLSGGGNDAITMMTNVGNIMMLANKNNLMSWNDYTLENFDLDIGCVSKKGYVKTMRTLYFIHYTGIYATSGGVPKKMSNKIDAYINGATKTGKENSAAGKKGNSIFFTLGDVTLYKLDGSINKVLRDVCIEYNLLEENWYIHTNVKASEFATFVEELNSDKLEFIDTAGNHAVKEFLKGNTDDGKEISFRVDTSKLTLQPTNFELSSNPISLILETERGSGIQAFVNLDKGEEYYPLEGRVVKGLSTIKIHNKDKDRGQPPICRMISISLRDNSKQICKLSRATLTFLPTTEVNNDNKE